MNKHLINILLLTILCSSLSGQWYEKKYGAASITELSDQQLATSLDHCRLVTMGGFSGIAIGGVLILAGYTAYRDGLPEETTATEDLLGARTIRFLYKAGGAALTGAGVIAVFLGSYRSGDIKSEIRKRGKTVPKMIFTPTMISSENGSLYPGIGVNVTF
jgi:hypothetical protein